MATFQDLQNEVLFQCRFYGVNFGSTPMNGPQGLAAPYALKWKINQGYSKFIEKTLDAYSGGGLLKIATPSVANTNTISLNPVPANGATVNPSALKVYEYTYTQNQSGTLAQERYIRFVSTVRFRRIAGSYVRRLGNYAAFPQAVTQMFGRRQLDMVPGTATSGDIVQLTIAPDPLSSPALCPATNGGLLVNDADVPIFEPNFHLAPAYWAAAEFMRMADRDDGAKNMMDLFQGMVDDCLAFGDSYGEGDPEQMVNDPWGNVTDPEFTMLG